MISTDSKTVKVTLIKWYPIFVHRWEIRAKQISDTLNITSWFVVKCIVLGLPEDLIFFKGPKLFRVFFFLKHWVLCKK